MLSLLTWKVFHFKPGQVVECLLLILGAVDGEFFIGLFVAYILMWNTNARPGGNQGVWLHLCKDAC
jgi:hypothetical protein